MVEDSIPLFFAGFTTSFNTVVHKQIVTKRGVGTTTPKKGGERITCSVWGGAHDDDAGKLQRHWRGVSEEDVGNNQ